MGPQVVGRGLGGLAAVLVLLVFAWPAALGGATSYVVVSGVSMEPMLESGDLAVVRRASSYELGDVIAFRTVDGDVIHRIVGGSAEDGFVTQGDNVDRVDPYRPRPAEIRGREVLHLPVVGAWGLRLVQTVPAPLLAAAAILLALGGGDRRPRRRRANQSSVRSMPSAATTEATVQPSPFQRPAIRNAAICAVAALVVLPSVFLAWRSPTTVEVGAADAPIRHTLSTSLTGIAGEPTDLYPGGRSPTIAAGPDGAVPDGATALLRDLVGEVVVDVSHAVTGRSEVSGTGAIEIAVVTGTGFVLPLDGVAPTAFSDTFDATVTVDLAAADARFSDFLTESGLDRDSMSIRVSPTVTTSDGLTVDGGPVTLRTDGDVISIDGPLRTVVTPEGTSSTVTATAALVGLPLPVPVVRWLGLALLLGLVGVAAFLVRRELAEQPHLRIGLLHGSLLVDVAPETTVGGEVVRVVSVSELARLARRDQRPILHQERADGSHHYLVPDGELTYEFVIEVDAAPVDDPAPAPDQPREGLSLDDLADVPSFGDAALDELPMTPADLPSGRAVMVEDFAALTRIWMRDNPAPGRMQRRRLPDGRTRFSVVRDGREFVYETRQSDRVGASPES